MLATLVVPATPAGPPDTGRTALSVIARGSALVVSGEGDWRMVDYEGGIYGQANLRTYADRAAIAYERARDRAPSSARIMVSAECLCEVGAYDPHSRRVIVTDPPALAAWLGCDGERVPAGELVGTDARSVLAQAVSGLPPSHPTVHVLRRRGVID